MVSLHTEIAIAAAPSRVREIFLDFPSIPTWSKDFVKSITVTTDPPKPATELAPGDTLAVELAGMSFTPAVVTNTAEEFRWMGSMAYVFTGRHFFRFEDDGKGETRFVQGEDFSGLLSPMMALPFGMAVSTKQGFEKFNAELKRKVETGA